MCNKCKQEKKCCVKKDLRCKDWEDAKCFEEKAHIVDLKFLVKEKKYLIEEKRYDCDEEKKVKCEKKAKKNNQYYN